MPAGWRRKKSSKKKNQKAAVTIESNLDSNIQENGKEKVPIVNEEENEVFETPRSQLDHVEVEGSTSVGKNGGEFVNAIKNEVIFEKVGSDEKNKVDVVDNEKTPKASIEEVDASSSNEKEIKVVPWPDESMDNVKEDVNANDNTKLDMEMKKDDGLEEANLKNLGGVNEHYIPVTENSNAVESIQEVMPHVDENLSKSNEETHENSDSWNGAIDAKEAEIPSVAAEKTEILERNEVACRGPTIARRATIWNCCGLLEALTSSAR